MATSTNSYVPATDAALDVWSTNFSALITASPASYGLVTADAVAIAAAYSLWHTSFLAATNGTTRGPMTIADKDAQKVTWLATARPYAQQIAANAGVTTENKVALGINARTNTPTPVPAPATQPTLALSMATPLQHQMRYRDSTAGPSVKAKPAGVIQCQVFAVASATVISDPATIPLKLVTTKSPFVVDWDESDRGKTVYYTARWITRSGLVGPFSAIVPVIVI